MKKVLKPLLQLVYIGNYGIQDIRELRTLLTVNFFSVITCSVVVFAATLIYFFVSTTGAILIPAIIEFVAFALVIGLNMWHRNKLATILFFLFQNAAVLYFGLVLQVSVWVHLMTVFLFSISLLLFQSALVKVFTAASSLLVLGILIINYNFHFIQPVIRSDGGLNPINFIIYPVMMANIALVFVLHEGNYTHFINRLQSLADELNDQKQQLVEANRQLEKANISKSIYVRETSHEMRQPFNTIMGSIQLLMQADQSKELKMYRPLIQSMYSSGNQGLRIINNVLEMSRIEAGKFDELHNEVFSIRPWLKQVVATNQYLAGIYGLSIVTEVAENVPAVILGDKNKLSQVLMNLLANAIKFSPTKKELGAIQVKVELLDSQKWRLVVKDDGVGIPAEKIPLIFDPFVTTRLENGKLDSSGLGLPITKKLVTIMNGSINVESEVGKGTIFFIELPLIKVDTKTVVVADVEASIGDLSRINVLIIEDDRLSANMYRRFLTELCNRVFIAENGEDGIRLASEHLPDIILLDSFLPDMTGKQILERLKDDENLASIPVIIVSGAAMTEDKLEIINVGVAEYFTKPVNLDNLQRAMLKSLPGSKTLDLDQ
ncbi:MAG TPA: ATP-binding protein [Chitinophaga sp.]|uniref:ATP-binding response regulator n=1 Tax=Chitinophaga sp. TaxID=1869181 RepID=UPI002C9075A9|nr:ATP-binding protein [Chitinophaga sp.]HVI46350.1 ATP-binding protein [Chitinophaga sp.]